MCDSNDLVTPRSECLYFILIHQTRGVVAIATVMTRTSYSVQQCIPTPAIHVLSIT